MDIFNRLRASLKAAGLIREVFTFVDASQLVSKLSTWDERDRAIAKGLETFNNETAFKIAAARQARFGSKGKDKYWYGYQRACISGHAIWPNQQGGGHACQC